ncbi:lysozyme [Capsaspora owczarzaki ATCC 30864]|uniref:Lysozyme n=1 Tax=Capsaspora owczarzaki (strain ATCC 30864) TaxID=595528 RepID=A0A0D2WV93_CAPO3|nr:lysozyme [Capsaspora owczarzaki ATCC 30864]KJE96725.1 lysozyme [Capsaspora owczarzaki ATCC 30864]|eukprot:XP_004343724.1 lysozyme [Capsaspora owczarzaki ATCC 30864]
MKLAALVAFACVVCAMATGSSATYGVDVSDIVSEADWNCLSDNGYDFAIVRAGRSTGTVDLNAAQTIINARNAGIPYVDAYIFPCYSCGNPADQIRNMVNNLRNAGASFGMIWLDIEGSGWSSSTSANIDFIQSMAQELINLGVSFGTYTSYSQWSPITGNANINALSSRPLWYAHYDNEPSFDDFSSFGGWSKPAIKQYDGDATACSVGVDKNWYP